MKKILGLFYFYFCFNAAISTANPFFFDIDHSLAGKQICSIEEYLAVANEKAKIDIDPLLLEMYPANQGYTTLEDFMMRCKKGICLQMIDPEHPTEPVLKVEKIGNGGPFCFVCYISYNLNYVSLLKDTIESLRETGFNGYFVYRIGGYPQPTGQEIQLSAVPYAFKIFMMLEAHQLGFNEVLWIDATMQPLRDPTPIFEKIRAEGLFVEAVYAPHYFSKYIFPHTRWCLEDLTGVDVAEVPNMMGAIFGLKMDTEISTKFVKQYYQLVALGIPFLSCFPEQYVITALLEKDDFKKWEHHPMEKLCAYPWLFVSPINTSELKEMGYYFYLKPRGA